MWCMSSLECTCHHACICHQQRREYIPSVEGVCHQQRLYVTVHVYVISRVYRSSVEEGVYPISRGCMSSVETLCHRACICHQQSVYVISRGEGICHQQRVYNLISLFTYVLLLIAKINQWIFPNTSYTRDDCLSQFLNILAMYIILYCVT